ncbi:MAG: UTP--glucose-1-phosphate uridylyltransferase, partial [Betaproteobacteria bacterium]|nr:UTP--glucose-1-phosphate uridylyltransferase [Betaproteobacteria bacterium]
ADLEAKGKTELLEMVRAVLPAGVRCVYLRQGQALGLGHAVLCAQPVVGNEPFAVILADDLMRPVDGGLEVLTQMTNLFSQHHASLVAVQEVPRSETRAYGIVGGTPWGDRTERIRTIVEKPEPVDAPSNLAVVGRYLLTPRIFQHLAQQKPGKGGEIQLTDAIARLLDDEPVLAYRYDGTRYDCGSKLGYLQATVTLGRDHAEIGPEFRAWLDNQRFSD